MGGCPCDHPEARRSLSDVDGAPSPCCSRGMAPVDVARHVGVDRRSVRRWRANHERAGPAGVGAKPVPGRPPKLDARRVPLEQVLLRGAEAAGFQHVAVDVSAGRGPGPTGVRRALSRRPCRARAPRPRLESAETGTAGAGARRGRHPAVGESGVAPHQKKRGA